MNITLNGREIDVEPGTTLLQLLKILNISIEKRMALLVNGDIAQKEKAEVIPLQEGDTVEAITLAGGG